MTVRRRSTTVLRQPTIMTTCTYESMDVLFEGGVVALFGVVEVDEEEDVGPDVMLLVDVVLKTLQQNTVARCTVQRRCPFFVNEICYF